MELIGQRIRHLRIEERLGQGGMGEVYLARDLVLDRLVAVKTLRAEQKFSDDTFLLEAELEIDFHRGRAAQARATFAKLDAMGWKAPRRPRLEKLLAGPRQSEENAQKLNRHPGEGRGPVPSPVPSER